MSHGAAIPLRTFHTVFLMRYAAPNKGMDLTAASVRSYIAPASGSSSCPALDGWRLIFVRVLGKIMLIDTRQRDLRTASRRIRG